MASAAVQFNADSPLFVIIIGWEIVPAETLITAAPVPAFSIGLATIFNVIPIACGLPLVAMPPFSAASEIEPVYVPVASPADVIVTVNWCYSH